MHALDWLNDVIQCALSLLPRVVLVRSTHGAVRFAFGGAKVLQPGVHFYLPICSEVQTICVVRQTINLPYQSLTTKDGVGVVVAVTVVYEVSDPLAALTTTDSVTDTILDVSQWSVKRVVSASSCDELQNGRSATGRFIDSVLRTKLSVDLSPYGIVVRQAFVSEFTRPWMVRLMGDLPT